MSAQRNIVFSTPFACLAVALLASAFFGTGLAQAAPVGSNGVGATIDNSSALEQETHVSNYTELQRYLSSGSGNMHLVLDNNITLETTLHPHGNNIWLDLNGYTITTNNDSAYGCMITSPTDIGNSGYGDFNNLRISNGTFSDSYNRTSGFDDMKFGHGSNLQLDNLHIIGNVAGHHIELGGMSGVTIDNCTIANRVAGGSADEAIQIDVCATNANAGGKPVFNITPYDKTITQNVRVTNCTFDNLSRAFGSHSGISGYYYTNILFQNNTVSNCSAQGIYGVNLRKVTISNNTFTKCAGGIELKTYATSTADMKKDFLKISGTKKPTTDSNYLITGNTIKTAGGSLTQSFGIKLAGGKQKAKAYSWMPGTDYRIGNALVANNTISGNLGDICLRGTLKTVTVSSNTLSSTKGYGVLICGACAGSKVTSNVLSSTGKDGILVMGKSKAAVTSNQVSSTGKYGINVFQSSSVSISRNKVTLCKRGGINVSASTKGIVIKSNTVSKNKNAQYTIAHNAKAKVNGKTRSGWKK